VSSARTLSCTNSTTHSPKMVCEVAVLQGPSGGTPPITHRGGTDAPQYPLYIHRSKPLPNLI
jgi:hypothetical protein